ncbi:MAG: MEMO1 family protein [Chloroflexota bacterium]
MHHRREHAIELVTVWLHWALRQSGRAAPGWPPLVPILCGSFHGYVQSTEAPGYLDRNDGIGGIDGRAWPEAEPSPVALAALATLADVIGNRRALVVAAADLAHVGPAFGDAMPLTQRDRIDLAGSDARLLQSVLSGDAGSVLGRLRAIEDRTRVCGLPPIYWAMRLLEHLHGRQLPGRLAGYRQCPADEQGGSVVSIAGVLWEGT